MSRWHGRVIYIDGFAGPGVYQNREAGSPIIALRRLIDHKFRDKISAQFGFFFIERDKARCESLRKVINELTFPTKPIILWEVECGEFNEVIEKLLDDIDKKRQSLAPCFVLIDPFGFSGVRLALIERLMKNKSCEVLITFIYEEMERFCKEKYNEKHLDNLFGTNAWKTIFNNKEVSTQERETKIRDLFRSQLMSQAKIKYVRSFKMSNKFNRPDYFLFFGTNNLTGLVKMKEAMWKVDKTGKYEFSDASFDPNQTVLFSHKPDYSKLKKMILSEFKEKKVSVEELRARQEMSWSTSSGVN